MTSAADFARYGGSARPAPMARVQILFGAGEDRFGRRIQMGDRSDVYQYALATGSKIAGGASLSEVTGGWINPEGQTVLEPGAVLTLLIAEADQPVAMVAVHALADSIRHRLAQAEVWVTVERGIELSRLTCPQS